MDPVVTARVPEDVRARGNEVLREIGANTTELVNSAFAYVIEHKALPKSKAFTQLAAGVRVLDASRSRALESFMRDVHVALPPEAAAAPFESLLDAAMEDRYADIR